MLERQGATTSRAVGTAGPECSGGVLPPAPLSSFRALNEMSPALSASAEIPVAQSPNQERGSARMPGKHLARRRTFAPAANGVTERGQR